MERARDLVGVSEAAASAPIHVDVDTVLSSMAAVGADLFFNETFGGNGRTCGTCHPSANNFTLDPAFIAKLPASDPLFVAEQVPPAAGTRRGAGRVDPPGDRAGAGDEDHADPLRRPRDQRHHGVVDDPHRPADAEPPQDVAHQAAVGVVADAGDAEAEGVDRAGRVEGVDHLVERLLDAELAVGPQIRAAGARYGVVKNTLAKRAAAGTSFEPLTDEFTGTPRWCSPRTTRWQWPRR